MKRAAVPTLLGVVVVLAPIGCASSAPEAEPTPLLSAVSPAFEFASVPAARTVVDRAFLRGLVALKFQDFERARREVGRVADACATEPVGGRALLTLAAIELDPRNPEADAARARRHLERYFLLPEKPAWTEPMAETLYLLALDLGDLPLSADVEEDTAEIDADAEPAPLAERAAARPAAIRSGGEFAPTREECAASTAELRGGALQPPLLPRSPLVEQLAELVLARDSLETSLEGLEAEVAELRQEIDRIRETLRP